MPTRKPYRRPVFMRKKGYFGVIFVTELLCIPGSRKKICIENKIVLFQNLVNRHLDRSGSEYI